MLSAEEVLKQENLKLKKENSILKKELDELRVTKFADSKNLKNKLDKMYSEMRSLSTLCSKNYRFIERESVKTGIAKGLLGACLIGNCIMLLVIIFFK